MADVESAEEASAYLSSLSGDAAERITAMKWARYLGAAFGPSGALSALRYYAEIGWIGDDVRRTMVDYVRGLTIEELELSEVEPDLHGSLENLEGTEFERHARSLQFVAAISGRSIEHGLASLQLAESIGQRGLTGVSGVGASAAGQPPSMGPGGGPFGGGMGLEPGEEAQRAARQREADRRRRDERATEADTDPDLTGGPDGEPTNERAHDEAAERSGASTREDTQAEGSTTDSEGDVEVSMADVTPGSAGEFDDVDTAPGDDEGSETAEADIDVGDETVSAGDPGVPDPEPSPAPSPSESAGLDDLDATFDDGEVEPDGAVGEETTGESATDEETTDDEQTAADVGTDDADETDGAAPEGDPAAPPDEERCIALTRDGDRCSLPASDGEYCHQHAADDE